MRKHVIRSLNIFGITYFILIFLMLLTVLTPDADKDTFTYKIIAAGCLAGLVTSFAILLYVSELLQRVNWDKAEELDKELKKTHERYEDNELFIEAMKRVIVRKTVTLEEIEAEKQKMLNNK